MDNASVLLRIYKDLTNSDFDVRDQSQRIIMQKLVYLLSEIGITVGVYDFVWDKYGPFSQSLHNDIFEITKNKRPYDGIFLDEINDKISFIKEIVIKPNDVNYDLRKWVEAIASCLYLKKYIIPFCTWEEINNKLKKLKPYLSEDFANNKAIDQSKKIMAYL